MIISYIDSDINSIQYQQREESFSPITDIFFLEKDKDIKIITERNPIIIRDLVLYYKADYFIVDSILDFPFSPTSISELIIFILNHNCIFISKNDSIEYDKNHIIDVYPKIFEIFRDKIEMNLL